MGRLADPAAGSNLPPVSRLARYAWFTLAFNVVVILGGALVRATASGAGCGRSWPTCRGEVFPELDGAGVIEYTHRRAAGVAVLLVAVLAVLVWRRVEAGHPARLGALLSLIAIVVEAGIGAMIVLAEWVAGDDSAARAVSVPLHLVNTLFLLAALALTGFWLSGGRRLSPRDYPRLRAWVVAGGAALVLISASGAVTALADTLFPKEGIGFDTSPGAHFLTRARVVHPILAILAAAVGWWASGRVEGERSAPARALPLLVGLMLVSGAANVALGVPTWMQLVHLLLADLLWIAYVLAAAHALQVRVAVAQTA